MAKQNFTELFQIYATNILSESMAEPLADELGVSTDSLFKIGLGYHLKNFTHAYVIPERDNKGNIVGMMQRYPDGKKMAVEGSKRGLIYEINQEFMTNHSVSSKVLRLWVQNVGVVVMVGGDGDLRKDMRERLDAAHSSGELAQVHKKVQRFFWQRFAAAKGRGPGIRKRHFR